MEIRSDVVLPFPLARVFSAYRDRMTELVPHLPNVRSIELKERIERPGEVEIVSVWMGGGDIPKVVRGVLSESMLSWTDYATWIEDGAGVVWRTEVHAFPGAVTSAGRNRFVGADGETRLEIRGALTIDPARVPGIPRFLGKSVAEAAERFIVGQVRQNSEAVARGVRELLRSGAA